MIVKGMRFLTLVGCLFLFGCGDTVLLFRPEKQPYDRQLVELYDQIQLKQSGSAEVLSAVRFPEEELLSQSESVLAWAGEQKKGYKRWLSMVAFDEDALTAGRKYLLIADERPKRLVWDPWELMRFDCEMVLESKVLDEPYSNENARRIAILRHVLKNTNKDVAEVSQDDKDISISGLMINQAMQRILVKLDASAADAVRLSDDKGMAFGHPGFKDGRIRMVIAGDVVTVKMMLGKRLIKRWGSCEEQ